VRNVGDANSLPCAERLGAIIEHLLSSIGKE